MCKHTCICAACGGGGGHVRADVDLVIHSKHIAPWCVSFTFFFSFFFSCLFSCTLTYSGPGFSWRKYSCEGAEGAVADDDALAEVEVEAEIELSVEPAGGVGGASLPPSSV
jgi:hypothetical protein